MEHEHVVKLVKKAFSRLKSRGKKHKRTTPRIRRVEEFLHRPSEQVHIIVGLPSCPYDSKLRFESYVVNEVLGGGVTSRLYQNVREDKGLVYGINSFLQSFMDTGLFLVASATSSENTLRLMKSIRSEFRKFLDGGIKERELETFKTQVKGQIVLGSEDMENRMNSLGVNEMVFEEYRPVDRVIADIEKVSMRSVRDYVHKYFDLDQVSLMVMGDLKPEEALGLFKVWE
jgi:predicted Zn-dependent peptidase